jgi:hypothetical protein
MATWVFDCKNCSEAFPSSLVPDVPACPPSRPAFPPQRRECPHCRTKSTYQPFDLSWRIQTYALDHDIHAYQKEKRIVYY